jgi:hypothetical protein
MYPHVVARIGDLGATCEVCRRAWNRNIICALFAGH